MRAAAPDAVLRCEECRRILVRTRGIRAVSPRRLIVEADGGSRGNPGPAGYGAVVRDASTGEVLAERYEYLGVATNNVAEYRGLMAGLDAAHEIDPEAYIEAPARFAPRRRADVRALAGEAPRPAAAGT